MHTGLSKRHRQSGLTLVEFGIVLVILGLIVGGVLKARELMTKAKVTRLEMDHTKVGVAIQSYRERYGMLPGDDPGASMRFAGEWRGSDNGNGDGAITGGWNSRNNANESRKIWKHLRGAGLIDGPVDTGDSSYEQPRHAFGGLIGIDRNMYDITGLCVVFGGIPGDIAGILEARGDDGMPGRGAIQAHKSQARYVREIHYDVAFRLD